MRFADFTNVVSRLSVSNDRSPKTKHLTLPTLYMLLLPIANSDAAENARVDPSCGQLFFTDVFLPTFSDGLIERMNFDGTGLKSLVSTGDGARGIAVDFAKSTIYWSDVNRHAISKDNLDGKHPKDVVTTGLNFPSDVDIDIKSKKIYWSDQLQNQIGRANLDGTDQTIIIAFPCAPSVGIFCIAGGALAIDSVEKKLYWTTAYCSDTTCSRGLGNIMKSNLDGSNIEAVLVAVGSPSSIQVDPIGKKIYWVDSGIRELIRRSNLDGTEIEDLVAVVNNNNVNRLALDLQNGFVYWDQDRDEPDRSCIKRMRLNGEHPEDVRCGLGNVPDIEFVQPRHPTNAGKGDGLDQRRRCLIQH